MKLDLNGEPDFGKQIDGDDLASEFCPPGGGIVTFLANQKGYELLRRWDSYLRLSRTRGMNEGETSIRALALLLLDLAGDRERQPDVPQANAGGKTE